MKCAAFKSATFPLGVLRGAMVVLPYFSRTACKLTFPATAWEQIRRNLGSWRRDFSPDGLVPTHTKSIKIAQAQFVAQKISTKNV